MRRTKKLVNLITNQIEIDLYECMKYDPFRHNGQIRAYIAQPYHSNIYLRLASTKQRFGCRVWFWCKGCNRRTSKMYVWSTYGYTQTYIACRHCLDLKYASQYQKDADSRLAMTKFKLARLEKQKRRLWYADKPTQFGKQFYKLREESEKLREEASADIQARVAGLGLF